MENRAFGSKVRRSSGCWLWTACINNKGYGRFRHAGQEWLAHRFAYTMANGPIPTGMLVMHSCDTPLCVNPNHLTLGTHWDNNHDCIAKKRSRKNSPKGSLHSHAKMTEDQVTELRREYISGTPRDNLMERYQIGPKAVSQICSGETWAHILGLNGAPTLVDLQNARRLYPGAVLTENAVREIRRRCATGERRQSIADHFGVTILTVRNIKQRKTWAHVDAPCDIG